jgi:hypothetical protein
MCLLRCATVSFPLRLLLSSPLFGTASKRRSDGRGEDIPIHLFVAYAAVTDACFDG